MSTEMMSRPAEEVEELTTVEALNEKVESLREEIGTLTKTLQMFERTQAELTEKEVSEPLSLADQVMKREVEKQATETSAEINELTLKIKNTIPVLIEAVIANPPSGLTALPSTLKYTEPYNHKEEYETLYRRVEGIVNTELALADYTTKYKAVGKDSLLKFWNMLQLNKPKESTDIAA